MAVIDVEPGGEGNDRAAIQAALDAAAIGDTVRLLPGAHVSPHVVGGNEEVIHIPAGRILRGVSREESSLAKPIAPMGSNFAHWLLQMDGDDCVLSDLTIPEAGQWCGIKGSGCVVERVDVSCVWDGIQWAPTTESGSTLTVRSSTLRTCYDILFCVANTVFTDPEGSYAWPGAVRLQDVQVYSRFTPAFLASGNAARVLTNVMMAGPIHLVARGCRFDIDGRLPDGAPGGASVAGAILINMSSGDDPEGFWPVPGSVDLYGCVFAHQAGVDPLVSLQVCPTTAVGLSSAPWRADGATRFNPAMVSGITISRGQRAMVGTDSTLMTAERMLRL